ncbi:MAG: spore cortex biosynthesis protein YabQ, partial [Clostridia bacterium]
MNNLVVWQSTIFLYSLLIGVALSIVYDVIRILRKCFKLSKNDLIKTGIEDIIFFAICSFLTFLYLLKMTEGNVRGFIILGEIVGFALHHYTFGFLFMKISDKIIHFVKFILKLILKPIFKLFFMIFHNISSKCKIKFEKLHKIKNEKTKKLSKKHKKPLKYNDNLVY